LIGSEAVSIAARDWALRQDLKPVPFDGKTVVVTHHAPSSQSVHPRYANDLLTPAFASNLENLMDGDRAALWIHGHMHDPFDYEIYGTRVVCSPRGYAPNSLTPEFRPDWVVEV
jgi:calcineurin-like phosphoesterase family protein